MIRFAIFSTLCVFFIVFNCSKPDQIEHYIFCHDFQETVASQLFANGLKTTADSLGVHVTILNQTSIYPKKNLDSLFKSADGVGYQPPLYNDILKKYISKVEKKQAPIIHFQHNDTSATAPRVDSNYYTAGRAAGRHILEQFGETGRFGILTPTLENKDSNESIRGFRHALLHSKSRWKQINIITCNGRHEQALKQYRRATRFGNRIIWFIADDCGDYLLELEKIKKDNFFIAIDLHPNENSIKFIKNERLDAIVTKDFTRMGSLGLVELYEQKQNSEHTEAHLIDCGSIVLTKMTIDDF